MAKKGQSNSNKKSCKNDFVIKYCLSMIFFALFAFIGSNLATNSLSINSDQKLRFQEKGTVNYIVCLKENEFFDEECLTSNMSYVASLIKNISLDFDYNFNDNQDDLMESLYYEIIAKLSIKNTDTNKKYYEKEYVLAPKTNAVLNENKKLYNLEKNIKIDYDYYNNIATSFKSQYGVDSQSYLEVYLNVYKKVNSKYEDIPSSSKLAVTIPLSQKALEIKFNTQEINKNIDRYIPTESLTIKSYFKLIAGLFLILVSIGILIYTLKMITKYAKTISKYDKFINRILKEYDRLIVETSTFPKEKDYNVLIINRFSELVDVRDNLRTPIMFYTIKEQKTAKFYILHDKNLYLYSVSAKDVNSGEKSL